MRARGVRWIFAAAASSLAMAVLPSGAVAAVTIGSVQSGIGSTSCAAGGGFVQLAPPAGVSYTAPSDGVITAFAFTGNGGGAGGVTQTKLLVLQPLGGTDYRITGASQLETVDGEFVVTRATRVSISAGQTIGTYGYGCRHEPMPAVGGMVGQFMGPEPAVGATQTYTNPNPGRLILAATIEPDADRDGFGDETQDQCPAEPSQQQAPCDRVAPDATITKQPKDKTKKKRATFEFTSNEPGSTFICTLDGQEQFKPCTSPLTVKVKRGRHAFSVTAIDATGNADPSAATDSWKVKKKKRR